ncbi:ATPase dynein-related AAA domain [Trinorchestia longiramus]|nr:ATPase dynein-related AAA domain [Trinorchestia longiramus]
MGYGLTEIAEGCFSKVLPVVCNALLQPHLMYTVGIHLRPWLPELLQVLASHPFLKKKNVAQHGIIASSQSTTTAVQHDSDTEESSELKRKQTDGKNTSIESMEVSNPPSKNRKSNLKKKKAKTSEEATRKRAAEAEISDGIPVEAETCNGTPAETCNGSTPEAETCNGTPAETCNGSAPEAEICNGAHKSQVVYCPHYLKMHRSLCVATAKLLPISLHSVTQFVLEYFEHHPPPYAGNSPATDEQPPLPKKPKLGFEVSLPQTSTEDMLESTYQLVLVVERELSELWQWADLIIFTENHHSNLTRWLACQCIGALNFMTKAELETLTLKYVAEEVAHKFSISFAQRQQEQQFRLLNKLSPVWKDENDSGISSKKKTDSSLAKTAKKTSKLQSNDTNEKDDMEETEPVPTTLSLQHTNFVGKNLLPLSTAVPQAGSAAPLLLVKSTESNVWRAWCGVVASRPVLLEGQVGCGKTATVEHLAALTGRTAAPYLTKVQLGEQTDSRSLLGTYRCTATPGEFIWTPGAVTRAVTAGHWLLLEDIDAAQRDVVAIITSLVEDRVLMVPGTGAVVAHRDFRLLATRRLTSDGRRMGVAEGSVGHLLDNLWCRVLFSRLTRSEMIRIVHDRYPRLTNIAERLVSVYLTLAPDQLCEDTAETETPGAVANLSLPEAEINSIIRTTNTVSSIRASGRLLCFRDLLKWAHRIDANIHLKGSKLANIAFQVVCVFSIELDTPKEALDCFCAAVPDPTIRDTFAEQIASYLNLSSTVATSFCHTYKPSVSVTGQCVRVGDRAKLKKLPLPGSALLSGSEKKTPFSFTRQSCLLLERVAVAVQNQEPVLIVGETGTGKTTSVQFLAQQTHQKLKVVNMNQQSDATDLLGGFKPMEVKTILFPLREEFEQLFSLTMHEKANFLRYIMNAYGRRDWKMLLDLMLGAQKIAIKKLDKSMEEIREKLSALRKKMKSSLRTDQPLKKKKKVDLATQTKEDRQEKDALQEALKDKQQCSLRWAKLRIQLEQAKGHVEKLQSALAFGFIEGTLTKAIAEGNWVLLDEINLANAETLECLSSLLESKHGSLTLLERGDDAPVVRHPNFRLFACMNPATDVGKKELPPGLRNRFTEFYMEDLTKKEDLEILISDYLIQCNPSPKLVQGIWRFYEEVRRRASAKGELADTTGTAPHYSLRTLCRALAVAAGNPAVDFDRSLYEAFCLSFLTQLDRKSYPIVEDLILKYLIVPKKSKSLKEPSNLFNKIKKRFSRVLPHPARVTETNDGLDVTGVPQGTVIGDYVMVAGYWVSKGIKEPQTDEQYILTKSVKWNLRSVVRIVSLGHGLPVLLQGDTSVGKTSLITYLARKCGVPCIRINNHEHTDIQEYLGSYAPDENGKLIFREGALVTAMRQGQWIILDELNLAPTDVLEALNRLLDDNRELYLPETQETVKAHPNFRLFATQNPPGLYGGRKVLSRAFRNRFVELHFDDIPGDELVDIIHRRCCLSEQHSKKLVSVLQALQMRRGRDNVFQGHQSLVTLRDLFRWAERYHHAQKPEQEDGSLFYEWEQHLADEGYLVLAGRVRNDEENNLIKEVLEEKMRCKINSDRLFKFNDETSPVTRPILENLSQVKGFEHMVFTDDMLRLYVLLSKALSFGEPVLLVGETGCGKTTVCQMIAVQQQQKLYSINCHMHTEGADFLGGLRPVRLRSDLEDDRLFEWVDGPLIHAMREGGMFLADEISLAEDSVLERLNSVLEPERTLVLAEKGSSNDASGETLKTEVVVAHEAFRLIGTMNPGGDYGKKELSPAMRNRFTEIWCPKIEIQRASCDVLNIVEHNVRKGLVLGNQEPGKSGIGAAMLDFWKFFTSSKLGKLCTVSIRDIISWVQFINKVTVAPGDEELDVGLAYIHGACLVLLDGLGSGLTGTGVIGWEELKEVSLNYVYQQVWSLTGLKPDLSMVEESCVTKLKFVDEAKRFGIQPFFIEKGKVGLPKDEQFTFVAPRTCINLVRVLRGLQLSRPLLLEGSPGVGKTSLVVALAKASSNDIVRINLSEQTDVSDLFGADLPVEGANGGKFAWRDGPLLQALRNGSWVVLDELNLASQSVLEGLNACFDHRGEVFVPELGQSFKVSHNATKIFACQNPQYQGGARKGLPRSFLNRFTQVHIEPLSSGDLEFILLNVYGDKIDKNIISKMVKLNERLVHACEMGECGKLGGPWELNLRDLFRWCDLTLHYGSKMPLRQIVDLLYASRMRTPTDRRAVHSVFSDVFPECATLPLPEPLLHISKFSVSIGPARIDRVTSGQQALRDRRSLCVLQEQLPLLQHLLTCVSMKWLVLLVGGTSAGKSALVQQCAALAGTRLRTISLSPEMDVGELLGGFEQVDHGRKLGSLLEATREVVRGVVNRLLLLPSSVGSYATEVQRLLHDMSNLIAYRKQQSNQERSSSEETYDFLHQCDRLLHILRLTGSCTQTMHDMEELDVDVLQQQSEQLLLQVQQLKDKVQEAGGLASGGMLEWVDSPLVVAIREGQWVVVEGASLCAASVLDRLNPLLEPGGRLVLSERGVIEGTLPFVLPHPNFRIFLVIDHTCGLVSRAMRNRGVELFVPPLLYGSSFDACAAATQARDSKDVDSKSCDSGLASTDDGSSSNSDHYAATPDDNEDEAVSREAVSLDLSTLLTCSGLHNPRQQNCLVAVHRAASDVLPFYLQPGVSVLLQTAKLAVQLMQSGEAEVRALTLAITEGYVRAHGTTDLQQQVSDAVKRTLQKSLQHQQSKSWPALGSLSLQTRTLQQHGAATAVLLQSINYLHCLMTTSNLPPKVISAWTNAPLPPCEVLPDLHTAAPELLALVFAGLPLNSWPLLLHGAKAVIKDGQSGLKLIAKMDQVVQALKSGKLCFSLPDSKDYPADARFAGPSLLPDDASSNDNCGVRNSSANRLMLGVWRTLVKSDSPTLVAKSSIKGAKDVPSLLQVSKTISKKKLDKSLAPHACVQNLYPLLLRLSVFIADFCAATDASVPFSDTQWVELCTVLRWMDRLQEILAAPESLSSFKLLLPKIMLHWQFFQDKFFKNIPSEWITCSESYEKLDKTVQKLTRVFAVNCGPVHEFAAKLSLQLPRPNPFPTEVVAEIHTRILKLSERLRPNAHNPSRSAVLVSSVHEKVKIQLVGMVPEFIRGKLKPNEMLEQLEELEKVFNSVPESRDKNSSIEPLNAKVASLKMQSWPVVDLITSQLLAHNFCKFQTRSAEHISHVQELVTAAPSLPVELLEVTNVRSRGWVAAHLHASISNSTACRNSVEWLGCRDGTTRHSHTKTMSSGVNKATKEASKPHATVHSPVQCLLTNILALTSNKEAVQVLQVGVHSEKAKQLQDIRATLWACWPAIADPSLSPRVSFAQHVKNFSQNLIIAFTRVLDLNKRVRPSEVSMELFNVTTNIRERCATVDVVEVLDEIQKFSGELEKAPEETDVVNVARLGAAVGVLQGWLAGHLEAMDPTEKRKLLLLYAQKDIKRLNQEILQHSWLNILRGGKKIPPSTSGAKRMGSKTRKIEAVADKSHFKSYHPHVGVLQQTLSEAQATVATVSQEVAYRPGEEEYVRLTQDLTHFLQAAFNPPDICDMVCRLCDDQVSLMTIDQIDRKLITLDNFFNHIHKEFLLFRDVTSLFMEGLSMVVRSLRVLNAQARLRIADSSCGGNFTQVLQRLSSFPILRNPRDPLDYLGHIDQDVSRLTNFLTSINDHESSRKRCQSLALRTSLFELHLSVATAGRLNSTTATLLSNIVSRALSWWRKQEEERKRREEERASLFKYKAKEHAKNETEEETNAREFKEMFPSHQKDFDDLKEPSLEQNDDALHTIKETDQNEEEEEVSDWLREEHLWEITEVHFDLLSNHSPLPLQESTKRVEAAKDFGVVPAALQRVKLLHCALSSCGPVASCDLDRSSVGSHLIFNHTACKTLQDSHLATILVKPSNFYVDWRPSEATKLRPLLVPLLSKIDQLLIEWPEHPTLLLVVGVVKRVLQFPVTSPLPKLLAGLEAVLLKAAIWEANAHKGVSLIEYLPAIKTQVVQWRAVELHEWKNCLELVTYNEAFTSRMKWWPHLYDSLCGEDWDAETVLSLSQILKELMDTATLGDFETKLMLIGAFQKHLLVTNSPHEDVCNIIGNVWNYYSQFIPAVRAALAKQRAEIEKRVKDLVKVANYSIATYKDIDQVRNKVDKSCRGLHVLMSKWKKFLRVNNRDIWAKDAVEELKPTAREGVWDATPLAAVTINVQPPPALSAAANSVTGAKKGSLLLSINLYCSKSRKFVSKVVESLQYNECVESVEDVTNSVIDSYLKLSTDLSLTANEVDKDARLNKMKTVMKQRRVSVTRLFKQLGDMGVRYHRGNTLWTDDFFAKSLQKSTVEAHVLHFNEATKKEFLPLWHGCEKYYYRSMNRMQLLLERLTVPHQDLGPDLIKRIRGACKHLMLMSGDLRDQSTLLARNLSILTCLLDDLKHAPKKPVATVSTLVAVCDKIHSFSLSLSLSAAEVCAIIDTKPETEGLVIDDVSRKSPSQMQLVEARALLTSIRNTCKDIAQRSGHVVALCTMNSWPRIVNDSHVQAIKEMNSELCDVAKSLSKSVILMDSEKLGHMCLTRQLITWINSWARATEEVESWLGCPDQRLLRDDEEESEPSMIELENCTSALLYAVQCLYKKYNESLTSEDVPCNDLISNTMVSSLLADIKSLKLNYILKCLTNLVGQVSDSCSAEALNNLIQVQSLLSQYVCLCDNLLLSAVATGRSVGKLFSVLLAIFYQMANKGFCKPQDLQEGGTEGKLSFEDEDDSEAAGLAEGEGQKENPGDKDLKEENGVDMSEDFEGKLQDMERPEMDDENENEKEDENKMDDQMGDTEQGAETLDKKLWNEKEDEEGKEGEGNQDLEEDDSAEAGDDERESQIVAKEKHQNKKNKSDKEKGKEEETQANDEPEEMEEDRREPKQSKEEEDDEDDDGNFEDRLAGENKPQDKPEDDGKDIPDDLNFDEAEEERPDEDGSKDDADSEENPMEEEKKSLFPEGKDLNEDKENDQEEQQDLEDMKELPEEENQENGNEDEKNIDEMENTDKDFQADEVDNDEDDSAAEKEHKKNAGKSTEEEESHEDNQEEKQEDVEASKDRDTKNNAEAAPVDARDASKDQTKEAPKTDDSGQDREDEEEQQEETGEAGERTQESLGVGQSDAQPQDEEMHQGEQSTVVRDSKRSNDYQEEEKEKPKKNRKPGDVDERKVTGDPDKELRQGLMTSEKRDLQQDDEPNEDTPDNCDNEDAEQEDDSAVMRTIKKAEEKTEGQAVDAGTRDQAIEAPAPMQEDDAPEPEEEGVQQHLMDVDDKEEEEDSQVPERLDAEKQKGRGKEHRQGQEADGENEDGQRDEERMETEGEFVIEHTVQRPPETYFHTLLEQEKLTEEACFEDDVSATCARLQESRLALHRADDDACHAWATHQANVAPYAAQLSEQLRLILEPTQASRLRGDYRTGKRLNMRKVISYIASHFIKDKIWLRRTQPSKRTYHVLLAVDDSESMKAVRAEELAKQSIALVSQALTKLEVGKVGVVSFGSSTTLLHPLDDAFSDVSGANIFANLKFEQQESRFVELLESSVALFRDARGGAVAHSDTAQILLIISDGQTHARSETLRAAVRAARNDRIFVVFFVLDASEDHSFYDIQVWNNTNMTLTPLAEEFPFPFYLVVRDLTTLPHVLAEALRRWFELVTADVTR